MKKILFSLALIAGIITSCTLYMDEDDLPRREGDGYSTTEEIQTEGGSVTYKYAKDAIGVDEMVQSYITEVDDTIVFFRDDTPDEYLPREGEILVCGVRDKFPNGFNHRVITRDKVGNTYRCVCKPLDDIFEAFDVLEYDGTFSPVREMDITDEQREDAYEFFSHYDNIHLEGEEPKEAKGISIETRSDDWEDINKVIWGKDDIFSQGLGGTYEGHLFGFQGQIGLTGNVFMGAKIEAKGSKAERYKDHKFKVIMGFTLGFNYEISMGLKIPLPVSIPLPKIGFDLKVVAAYLGFTDIQPFIYPRLRAAGEISVTKAAAFVIPIRYDDAHPNGSLNVEEFGFQNETGDNEGIKNTLKNPEEHLTIDVGFDLGFGAEVKLVSGISAKFQLSTYLSLDMNVTEFKNKIDTYSRNVPENDALNYKEPLYLKADIGLVADAGNFLIGSSLTVGGAKYSLPSVEWVFPYFPQVDDFLIIPNSFDDEGNVTSYSYSLKRSMGLSEFFVGYGYSYEPYVYIEGFSDGKRKEVKLSKDKDNKWKNVFSHKEFATNKQFTARPVLKLYKEGVYQADVNYTPRTFHSTTPYFRVAKTGGGQGIRLLQTQKGPFWVGPIYMSNRPKYDNKYKVRIDLSLANMTNSEVVDFGIVCNTCRSGDIWIPTQRNTVFSYMRDLAPYVMNARKSEKMTLVFDYYENNYPPKRADMGEVFSTYITLQHIEGKTIYYWNDHRYIAPSPSAVGYYANNETPYIKNYDIRLQYIDVLETPQSFPEWGSVYDIEKLKDSGTIGSGPYIH